ncbi:MAG TPA: sulfite reductase subunit A [Desulfobacterales bacterium]|nr:sulfite reductase subunit A [Desulfobacterales bacterium]
MSTPRLQVGEEAVISAAVLPILIDVLVQEGFQPVGPTVQDGYLVLDALSGTADLPQSWTTDADAGVFRLTRRDDQAYFGFNLGQESWKKYLYPPSVPLFRTERQESELRFQYLPEEVPSYAFIGVRACELAALAIHDRIFLQGPYSDPVYAARRQSLFIVAVNCTESDAACFCASLGTGPGAAAGFDLALTEISCGSDGAFLVTVGTPRGAEVILKLPWQPATGAQQERARELIRQAAHSQKRNLSTDDLPGLLYNNYNHPHWDEVAARCLSCGNCTLVCPTCFCHRIEDKSDLDGQAAERWRHWDACHTLQFAYIHGGSLRNSPKSRYRQWLTHKLAAWFDQFGSLGCVGCGRCLVWCPVGIDLTAEVQAIRVNPTQE